MQASKRRGPGLCRDVKQYLAYAQEYHQTALQAATQGRETTAEEAGLEASQAHAQARDSADLVDLMTLDGQTRWSW